MRWTKVIIVSIYFTIIFCVLNGIFEIGIVGMYIIWFPICGIIVVCIHEISHWFFFRIFGFRIQELRLGILDIKYGDEGKKINIVNARIYSGCCRIYYDKRKKNVKLKISILAGGISGLVIGNLSLMITTIDNIAIEWKSFGFAMFCMGLYSFYATLLSPQSGDRRQLKKIKEG